MERIACQQAPPTLNQSQFSPNEIQESPCQNHRLREERAFAPAVSRSFAARVKAVRAAHEALLRRKNPVDPAWDNGVFERFRHPVVTYRHTPLEWRYDFNPRTNPFFMERLGINARSTPARSTGTARSTWSCAPRATTARASSPSPRARTASTTSVSGTTRRHARDCEPETNLYDMRLTFHEDGWIYGLFCAEARIPRRPPAICARRWPRAASRARGTSRPGSACPISRRRARSSATSCFTLSSSMASTPSTRGRRTVSSRSGPAAASAGGSVEDINTGVIGAGDDHRRPRVPHHQGVKNGQGPAPIKTPKGWLHLAHGVRDCAAGLRYVLYLFLSDPAWTLRRSSHRPGGYFLAP